jgi:hypothetical protein
MLDDEPKDLSSVDTMMLPFLWHCGIWTVSAKFRFFFRLIPFYGRLYMRVQCFYFNKPE